MNLSKVLLTFALASLLSGCSSSPQSAAQARYSEDQRNHQMMMESMNRKPSAAEVKARAEMFQQQSKQFAMANGKKSKRKARKSGSKLTLAAELQAKHGGGESRTESKPKGPSRDEFERTLRDFSYAYTTRDIDKLVSFYAPGYVEDGIEMTPARLRDDFQDHFHWVAVKVEAEQGTARTTNLSSRNSNSSRMIRRG